jgi:hypothetical protein
LCDGHQYSLIDQASLLFTGVGGYGVLEDRFGRTTVLAEFACRWVIETRTGASHPPHADTSTAICIRPIRLKTLTSKDEEKQERSGKPKNFHERTSFDFFIQVKKGLSKVSAFSFALTPVVVVFVLGLPDDL